jgi:predicted Zn-dependent protease
MKRISVFILCLLSAQAFAFDFSNLDVGKAVSGSTKLIKATVGLSDEEEIKVGRDVAANLAARYGLDENPAKLHYLNLIGQAIAKKCSRPNIPYHFGILKSSEINAMATPGGYVCVTDGLLAFVQDESELAGVLAHEISHVTQKHIVKAIRQADLLGAGQDAAAAAGKDVSQYGQLSDFSINLLSNGLSRGDEMEADKLGTILAAKVGYDPTGLRRSVERLGKKESSDAAALARFNKTHPPAADRLQAIDATLEQNHLDAQGASLAERYQTVFAKK